MQDLKEKTAHPASAQELADLLASANAANRSIETGGNFTKTRWGGPPAPADLRISTARLNQVLSYEPRDLTISVGAGMRYADLTSLLAANRQMIPLDPPYASHATVGGVLAVNQSGPRRRLYGTGRDLVIGMQFATMEGQLIQSGGMVVKNVAGLDMGKLMIGSYGTLAVVTSINFKLIPQDKAKRTFLLQFSTAAEALKERNRILHGVLQPAAIDLLNPAASHLVGQEGWILAIGAGGSQALIDRYSRELPSARVLEPEAEKMFWRDVETFPETFLEIHRRGAIVRTSGPLQGLAELIAGHTGPALARAGNGVAYLYHPELPARAASGPNAVVEAGPPNRTGDALWPEPGNSFPVMQRIKNMLDPKQLLNKGRLYGRI